MTFGASVFRGNIDCQVHEKGEWTLRDGYSRRYISN